MKHMDYWKQRKGYPAVNVDHPVFRFYGRILKPDFYQEGGNFERLLDFGCGQGAAVNFFQQMGFNARGVDISEIDIAAAKIRYPHLASNFFLCDPQPSKNECYGFSEDIAVVTAIQSLYLLPKQAFRDCLEKLYDSMRPGGIFFATMMSENSKDYFENSKEADDGMRVLNFKNDRFELKNYYMFFTKDENDLKQKFSMFKPLHIGYYAAQFRSDEGDGHHFTFCGMK